MSEEAASVGNLGFQTFRRYLRSSISLTLRKLEKRFRLEILRFSDFSNVWKFSESVEQCQFIKLEDDFNLQSETSVEVTEKATKESAEFIAAFCHAAEVKRQLML